MLPEYWSHSRENMRTRCGMQYFFRYVEGLKIPPGLAMLRGSSTHAGGEANLRQKIASGVDLPIEAVKELTRDDFGRRLEGEHMIGAQYGDIYGDDIKSASAGAIDDAVKSAGIYHQEVAPLLTPAEIETGRGVEAGVELRFEVAAGVLPVPVVGVIDVVEKVEGAGLGLRDTKSVGKSPNRGEEHLSLQPTFYELGMRAITGKPSVGFWFDSIVLSLKTRKAKMVSRETTRGDKDLDALVDRVERSVAAVDSERFVPCSPAEWVCSARWCGYYDEICPFGRRGRSDRPEN